ncbi:MAG: sulfatase family protein [Pseudomonadales bacterium]
MTTHNQLMETAKALQGIFICALFLLAVQNATAAAPSKEASKKTDRPNIVLMLSDDTSWFDIGPYDRRHDYTPHNAITPHLDQLAEEGMLFTSAFTSTALCSPARQQLYTGLFPVRSGAYPQHSQAYKGTLSIAHYFDELGYRIGLAGKKHVAPESVYPFETVGKDNRGKDGKTTFGIEQVEEFIRRDRQQPFFLIIASNNSHGPWNRGNQKLYKAKALNLPPFLIDTPGLRRILVSYYAEVSDLDNEVGLVDELLERTGVSDNTLFIFTSEHGAGLPFAKFTLYDAGLKTAFILRWPGKVERGSVSEAMIQYVDVLPTLIEAAGGEVPSNVDGKSFMAVLDGDEAQHRDYTYGVHTTRNVHSGSDYPIRSVRDRQHKLILNLMPQNTFSNLTTDSLKNRRGTLWDWQVKGEAGDKWAAERVNLYRNRPPIELYDLLADPFELNNLAGKKGYQPVIDKLQVKLTAWMEQQGDLGAQTELSACERTASFKTCP